jgi:glycosyltransferase involved in cell wall biosynthesis
MVAEEHPNYAEGVFNGTLIEAEVPLIYVQTWGLQFGHNLTIHQVVTQTKEYPVVWLLAVPWHMSHPPMVEGVKFLLSQVAELAPKHRCLVLCNTVEDGFVCERLGFDYLLVHQNQFVDRNSFKPLQRKKQYDAVINSTFKDYKRHWLATQIPSLSLISYMLEPDAVSAIKDLLPQAVIANETENGPVWMPWSSINEVYNTAKCGLILSEIEGGNYASIEYLLAGLPVVTTVNLGGRDRYLDGRFCSWVNADPDSVAKAVYNYTRLAIDPQFIRTETIRKLDHDFNNSSFEIGSRLGLDVKVTGDAFDRWRGHGFIQQRQLSYIIDRLKAVYG